MGTQWSNGLFEAVAGSIETAIGTSPTLTIRTGSVPSDTTDADSGTALVAITLPSDWGTVSGGTLSKNGTWSGVAGATGSAGHYRIKTSGGTVMQQGVVVQSWQASTYFALNETVINDSKRYRCVTAGVTASSGGPTGTGSGITDGAAAWDYVESWSDYVLALSPILLNRKSITSGQTVVINTASWSISNPT